MTRKKKTESEPVVAPPCERDHKEPRPIQHLVCSHTAQVMHALDTLALTLDRVLALEGPELELLRVSLRWAGDNDEKVKEYIDNFGIEANELRASFIESLYVFIKKKKLKLAEEEKIRDKLINSINTLLSGEIEKRTLN